ncbi:MAG: hypothetical protein ACI9W6_000180 [Motiliproteus sp.]|jgi:hypothetical protein
MKFSIDLELTPEEFRRVLGLPDVQELHKEMLSKVREKMGVEGFDTAAMLKLYSGGSVDQLQRMMVQLMGGFGSTNQTKDKD